MLALSDRYKCPNMNVGGLAYKAQSSKQNVEAPAKISVVRSKELAEAWVGGVGANVARVEVSGCVKDA